MRMNVILLRTGLLCRRESTKNDSKPEIKSFKSLFRFSVRNLAPFAINILRISSIVFLLGACDASSKNNIRQFLDEHPEFDVENILKNCSSNLDVPRPVNHEEAHVAFLTSHMGAFTDIIRPKVKYHARYLNAYSLELRRKSVVSLPNGTYFVTGWVADGRLSCDPEDSFSTADGIIFIESLEPAGE